MEKAVSRDGTEIAFEVTGDGSPLVLVHGAAGDHTRWAPVLPRLEEGFTVYAVDRRGRGGSGDSAAYAFEREVEDVVAVVEAIDVPVALLGHSSGAVYALEAALLTRHIAKLVIHEPPVVGMPKTPQEALDKLHVLLEAGDREALLTTMMREVVGMQEDDIALMKGHPSFAGRLAVAHTLPRELQAGKGYHFDPERFRRMDVPTLVLLGSETTPLDAESAFVVHRGLPNSRLVLMQGVEHVAIYKDPDLVASEVIAFLTEATEAANAAT